MLKRSYLAQNERNWREFYRKLMRNKGTQFLTCCSHFISIIIRSGNSGRRASSWDMPLQTPLFIHLFIYLVIKFYLLFNGLPTRLHHTYMVETLRNLDAVMPRC